MARQPGVQVEHDVILPEVHQLVARVRRHVAMDDALAETQDNLQRFRLDEQFTPLRRNHLRNL